MREESKMQILPAIRKSNLEEKKDLKAQASDKTIENESLPQIVKVEQFKINDQDRQEFFKAA